MRRFTLSPLTSVGLSVLATLTAWLVLASWQVFSERHDFLVPLFFLALVVGVVGGTLRAVLARSFWADLVTALLSVVIVFFVVSSLGGSTGTTTGWSDALTGARDSAQTYVSPVPDTVASIGPLLVVGGALVIHLVDLLVSTFRQVVLGGLVLLATATVPVAVTARAMQWWLFALVGCCYLVLLYGYQAVHLQRWGRGTDRDPEPGLATTATTQHDRGTEQHLRVPAAAAAIGALALGLAVVVPSTVPLPDSGLLGGSGWGSLGGGDSGGEIEVTNPVVDMRRDLERAADRDVLELTTDDPSPSYLRLGTLNSFNGSAWTPGDRAVTWSANGAFPEIPGASATIPRDRYTYRAHALPVLRSNWLPTMALTTSAQTDDRWTVDPATLDVFHGGDDDATTADLEYSFASVELDFDPSALSRASSGASEVDPQFLTLPTSMPAVVSDLARDVTAGQTSAFDRAVALQNWFRVGGGFEYSLERAPTGSGNGTLETFLDQRIGYCEQYASAMAVMARELGIPSRVAVGWLSPERIGEDTYMFSSHDAHAWTELYIKGAGWVAFEPTPSTRASRVPSYTEHGGSTPSPSPTASNSTSSTPTPSNPRSTSATPSASASASASPTSTGSRTGEDGSSLPIGRFLVVLAVLAGLTLLALSPHLARSARTRRRRSSGHPEEAWDELFDTALDLGLAPPTGRSLREAGGWYLDRLAAPQATRSGAALETGPQAAPEAADEIERLVHVLEARRYAPAGALSSTPSAQPGTELWPEHSLAALSWGVTSSARTRARWWPRSLFSRS